MSGRRHSMQPWRKLGQQALAVVICLSVAVWSILPMATHVPDVLDTLQDHAEMIATHGHSHGLAEDLAWALHGHSHDAMDHDHNQAFLTAAQDSVALDHGADLWRFHPAPDMAYRVFRIDRPPRA